MAVKQLSPEEIEQRMVNAREKGIWYLKGVDGQTIVLDNEVLIHALIEGVEKLGFRMSNGGVRETWH